MSSIIDLLVHQVDVLEIATGNSAEGGYVDRYYVVEPSVATRVQPAGAAVARRYAQQAMSCTHVLHFLGHLPITPLTRFCWRSYQQDWHRYDVLRDRWFKPSGKTDADELGEFTRCEVEEFDPDDVVGAPSPA